MRVYYQGTDITEFVQVRKCVMRDTSGDRCDSLEVEFENAADWFRWDPEQDDTIRVTQDAYDTGLMYLNTVLPEEGRYRILATALPCAAREKLYRSYAGQSVGEIMESCAMASGMGYAVYGIDGSIVIPYIQQEMETCASLLYKLLKFEGAQLKCVNGKYTAIGILWAQERTPVKTFRITADQNGVEYRRLGSRWRTLTVRTPYADASAADADAPENAPGMMLCTVPASNDIQAARWARGILLHRNRACEAVTMQTGLDPSLTAMVRADITGGTDADGAWLVDTVEHDLFNRHSFIKLRRCLTGIA